MKKRVWIVVLCLTLIVSVGFNIWQTRKYDEVIWWMNYFDKERMEFSIGHGLLANGTFFGDAKSSFVSAQVQFICNPQNVDKYDLIAVARVWDGMNIGRANLDKIRNDKNSSKLPRDEKHQIRTRSYQTDILPLVKNNVQSQCGKKDKATYTALQDFILNAVYNNTGYAIFE